MTDKIAANKGTSSIFEYSNSFDTSSSSSCANAINIDSNVLQFSKLNGDSGEESGTNSGTNDKKSFHITSVTVQRNSTDGNADESADESRTEELSDNVDSMSAVDYVQTDVATDLNSLDNKFGKDDVTYKVTSVGSAPIIPTSAQYGIAVVSGVNSGELSEVKKFIPSDCKFSDTVARTELIANGLENNCANVVAKELNTQIKNERFKVVKIESNEPFKRGRWVCMDFSDQSMDQVKKSAISISTENDKCAKKETSDKEISPSEILVNGTLMENILNDNESKVAGAAPQNSQVADSTYHNGDMSGMNSVSPNQTYNAPFIPSNSNVNQPQAQSLTHIIIAPSTQSQVASGSYGHSQSLPLNELQHVPQAAAAAPQQQQQQSIHLVSSLQQSFHTQSPPQQQQSQQHSSIPHPQAVISQQNMQHMSTVQSPSQQLQQQQSDNNVYNQQQQQQQSTPSAAMSVQQQQLPLLQQQYQPMQQNAPLNQTSAATQCNQRTATGSQTQQQMNMTQNGGETLISVNQSMPSQSQQFPQQTQGHQGQTAAMQQTVQHTMQQVPMQQQSFQHAIPPQQQPSQQQQQPILHQQQQPVQTMPPTQHHSPQQTNQPSVQSMPTQQQIPQQTSGAQANSQPSLQPNNLQQAVLQQGVVQQPKVGQPSAPVQYLPQQAAIQQSSQQPTASQTILNAPQQQAPPQVMQQQMPTGVDQLHIHQMQQQSQQQQQILSQQIPQQQPSQQISHIPQPTPQIPQQQSQQVPMQQPQIPQSMPSHHQPILQSIAQQQPQQMMQTQNMAQSGPPQTTSFQNVPPQQQQQQQQQQQPPQQTQPSQQAAQVMQQMQPTMQQMQPPPQQQQPIQSTQSIQHSFPQQQQPPQQMTPMNGGQQTMQAAYQTSVAHQNVSNQMADQNIPVSGSQVTYQQQQQHDVVMSNVSQQQSGDVLMSNVQSQYSLNQPQNIPVQTQLPLHVSLHQPCQNTPSSSYVNASTMNMLGNTSISQQTPPISQPQYYSHSGTSGSITSQDLQQLCGHQHHQPTMAHTSLAGHPNAVSSLATPLISTVTSQTLPPNMDYMVNTASVPAQQNGAAAVIAGQIPYSVHYQNGSSVGSSSNVQTQTTPISQSCSSTGSGGVPLQQYIQQGAPSILSAGAAQVPVSTSYSANISVVHPIQIQQRYVHNNMPAANQMYPTGQPTSFAETSINAENFQHNAYLPEQVVVEIKQDEGLRQDDSDNTAGSSNAVAIDNKIEQAMDLVKSHLMFAVREEVEVLKEKISELMDKINQLEIENSILKANASQETLAQLPPTHSSAPSTAAVSNTTSNTTQASIGPTNGQPP